MALLAYLLYASHGGNAAALGALAERAKPHVEKTIRDEDRRKAALHALSRATKDIDALTGRIEKDLGRFEKLVQDYGSRPEDFDRLFETAAEADLRQADEIWKDRAELLAHVGPEEWSAIVAGARADAAEDAAKAHEGKTE